MPAGADSGFGIREIIGVTMDIQYHFAVRIADGCIGIGRGVGEDPNYLVLGLLGGSSVLRNNGAGCNKHGGIHGNGIVPGGELIKPEI